MTSTERSTASPAFAPRISIPSDASPVAPPVARLNTSAVASGAPAPAIEAARARALGTTPRAKPELFLPNPRTDLKAAYDVVVIGSGYGGAIPTMKLAAAGHSVAVLEAGRAMAPGDFPETLREMALNVRHPLNPMGYVRVDGALDGKAGLTRVSARVLGGGSTWNGGIYQLAPRAVVESAGAGYPDGIYAALQAEHTRLTAITGARQIGTKPVPVKMQLLRSMADAHNATAPADETLTTTLVPAIVQQQDGLNPVGIFQRGCTRCGNCFPGCNVGAKLSLDRTAHQLAKRDGAAYFTHADVERLQKHSDGTYTVHFLLRGEGGAKDERKTVRARAVIVAAGVQGTQEILQATKADKSSGIAISETLGKGMTANGDIIGVAINTTVRTENQGTRYPEPGVVRGPGPLIGAAASRLSADGIQRIEIQDGTFPAAFASATTPLLRAAAWIKKWFTTDVPARSSTADAAAHSMLLLGFGAEHCDGDFHRTSNGRVKLVRDDYATDAQVRAIVDTQADMARAAGGAFVEVKEGITFGNALVAHPLGGVRLGQTTDAWGRIDDGIFVTDASVHGVIGTNPSATIAAFAGLVADKVDGYLENRAPALAGAERAAHAKPVAAREQAAVPAAVKSTAAQPPPGAPAWRFREMGKGAGLYNGQQVNVQLALDVRTSDTAAFRADPRHTLRAHGRMVVGVHTVDVNGTLQLMRQEGDRFFVVYEVETPPGAEPAVRFTGAKEVKNDPGFDMMKDLTVVRGRFEKPGQGTSGIDALYQEPDVELVFPGSWMRYLFSFHFDSVGSAVDALRVFSRGLWQYVL